ncbi:MAG: hypothetical protein GXN91_03775 [Epsilonproteobacteria bacterium]|nr:hypothetical protein [Campylobacterota bacterium]
MYRSIVISIIFFIIVIGCQEESNNFNNQPSPKEILTSTPWYRVDLTTDKYIIRDFSEDKMVEKRYSDGSFKEIISLSEYPLKYTKEGLIIYKDNQEYNCTFSSCEDYQWMVIECKPTLYGLETLLFCGWDSKFRALKKVPAQ